MSAAYSNQYLRMNIRILYPTCVLAVARPRGLASVTVHSVDLVFVVRGVHLASRDDSPARRGAARRFSPPHRSLQPAASTKLRDQKRRSKPELNGLNAPKWRPGPSAQPTFSSKKRWFTVKVLRNKTCTAHWFIFSSFRPIFLPHTFSNFSSPIGSSVPLFSLTSFCTSLFLNRAAPRRPDRYGCGPRGNAIVPRASALPLFYLAIFGSQFFRFTNFQTS